MVTIDQVQGCMLGLALGDAAGAPYEGGVLERSLWRIIGVTKRGEMRWTDDTQMSIDVAESLIESGRIDPDSLALRFATSYRWSRGYGPGAAKVLKRIARGVDWRTANRTVFPDGSYGNGAAMRSPIIGLFYADRPSELHDAVRQSAAITHSHPLGIEGAVLLAQATAVSARGVPALDLLQHCTVQCGADAFTSRLSIAMKWIESDRPIGTREVIRKLGNRISAHESCVTAVYVASRFREQSFTAMLTFVTALGGDVDTIGAMAGAIWGAANGIGALPADLLETLEQREKLGEIAARLHQRIENPPNTVSP